MKKYPQYLFVLLSLACGCVSFGQSVVINEIQSSNATTIADESGNYEDWLELYNNGASNIDLSGYGLSNDATLPLKWIFPQVVLAPKQYLLIWASGKNKTVAGKPLHTNFKLNASGEDLSLTNAVGTVVDKVTVKAMISDISYGRSPNGTGSFVFFGNCTPNAANSTTAYSEFLPPPTFSAQSGFFTQGFDLSLSSSTAGVTILYTLDGSEPDEKNLSGTTYSYKNQYPENPGQATGPLLQKSFQTLQYSGPVSIADRSSLPNKIASISSTYEYNPAYIPTNPIYKGTVVRAKAIKAGAISSVTASKTYFISPLGSTRFKLPVISLGVNENEFFDYNIGIYVAGVDFDNWRIANPSLTPGDKEGIGNYYRRGNDSERLANITYLINGTEVLNQDVGLSIHGGGSRISPSKSLTVAARSKYGSNSMDYKLFSDIENVKFERLILSNSGQDFPFTMFRDALGQEICKSLHCESESYQPAITFINGEYWGILNIREKYTDEYFSDIYNFGKKELDFIEIPDSAQEGDNTDYLNMIDYFQKNSLADSSNYNYILTRLDPESFSDFFIANIFLQNSDWPGNNVQCWRKRTNGYITNSPYGHDGRWRWALHDMDETFGFGTSKGFTANTLATATTINTVYPNPEWSTLFLRKLLENNDFKIYFINRFADLMNTAFLPSRIISKINTMKSVIEPDIGEHISRWKVPVDVSAWNYFVQYEQDFANARPAIQRDHIRQKFNITSNINAVLDVSDATQGYIKMNTIDIIPSTPGVPTNPYPWSGIYFSNIPVKIKAVPLPGYVFSYWSGASTSTEAEITLTPTDNFSLIAHFVPSAILDTPQIIYFWMMDGLIKDNTPLTSLNSSYQIGNNTGMLNYYSCLVGYPFDPSNFQNYRKADMERVNDPTTLNYLPQVNKNIAYAASGMKGIQITQPFQSGALENNLVFSFSTAGFKNIKFDIAAKDEGAATGIQLEYSTNSGDPNWKTAGIQQTSFPILSTYQLIESDFTGIEEANNNSDFKIRLRFTGPNMNVISNGEVVFNNVSVQGVPMSSLNVNDNFITNFAVYPNPVKDILRISSQFDSVKYNIFSVNGKTLKKGQLESKELNVSFLPSGLYLLQLTADGKSEVKKIIKN